MNKIINHGIDDLKFIIFDQEGNDWYNPVKPYTMLEYEWVRENIPINKDTVVIDAGCHHGNYSVVFKPAVVIAVDINNEFCNYARENMKLNGMDGMVITGRAGSFQVPYNPDIYKVDIEGAEYRLFPDELKRYPSVHTWIIEIHNKPLKGKPETIIGYFINDFDLLVVDRDNMTIREYNPGEEWKNCKTLIARKKVSQ